MPCERGTLVPSSDGLPGRCVGPWSKDKLYYVRSYLDLVSRAMRDTFPERAYVDLFAGPGRCVLDDDSGEIAGSPMIALGVPFKFTTYHFVEADPQAMEALRTRVEHMGAEVSVKYYPGDANDLVPRLVADLPKSSLDVAVIDPTGLHLRFESLRALAARRRIDLIYLFPEGMAVKRNLEKFLDQPNSMLDEVLGTDAWRSRALGRRGLPELPEEEHWEEVVRPIVEIFRNQLGRLGYVEVKLGSEIVVRNRRNVPLYYLVFASKHPLGQSSGAKSKRWVRRDSENSLTDPVKTCTFRAGADVL